MAITTANGIALQTCLVRTANYGLSTEPARSGYAGHAGEG